MHLPISGSFQFFDRTEDSGPYRKSPSTGNPLTFCLFTVCHKPSPKGLPELNAPDEFWRCTGSPIPPVKLTADTFLPRLPLLYYCPSRREPRPVWYDGTFHHAHGPRGMIDYGGNAGTDCQIINGWGSRGNGINGVIVRRPDGSDLRSDSVASKRITDGTSKTLLIGEKCMNADKVGTEDLGDDDAGFAEGWDFDIVRWGCYPPSPDIRDPSMRAHFLKYAVRRGGFGSSHPGGFNGENCDGSVRKFSFDIDFETFKNISNRQDGNVIQQSE